MKTELIVALDLDNYKEAESLVDLLSVKVKFFKVGSQLFTACGLQVVEMIEKKGARVFLDLKFHDIPNTVKKSIEAAIKFNVYMLTIHLSGGRDMIKAAADISKRPKIVGVTLLTSKSEEDASNRVLNLAKLAKDAGLDGVVCSVHEAAAVRWHCGENFIIVTPGIRPEGSQSDDQKRVATPKEAAEAGADFIVVGRPIIQAENPRLAAEEILKEIER